MPINRLFVLIFTEINFVKLYSLCNFLILRFKRRFGVQLKVGCLAGRGGYMLRRINKLLTVAAFVPALFISAAPIALADSITTTGADSSNTINNNSYTNTSVSNDNDVYVSNTSFQYSSSGDATVSGNTSGGSATTGDASASNSTTTSLSITNMTTMPAGGSGGSNSISNTGFDSSNTINNNTSVHMSVDNDNNVSVKNFNFQVAVSGDAKVKNNTSGGNASTGNASTSNSTCTSIQITNGGSGGASNNNACSSQNGGGQGSGGGNNGGTSGQNGGGAGAGQVLGASTIASLSGGGLGAGFATLPNTGLREGVNNWLVISILTIAASIGYWSKVIAPRLKNI